MGSNPIGPRGLGPAVFGGAEPWANLAGVLARQIRRRAAGRGAIAPRPSQKREPRTTLRLGPVQPIKITLIGCYSGTGSPSIFARISAIGIGPSASSASLNARSE